MIDVRFAAVMAALIASTSTLCADDYPFIAEALPPHLAEHAAAQGNQLLLGSLVSPDDFFIAGLKVWTTTQPIRVCFFGGPASLRARIVQIASRWTTLGGYVPLDFGNPGDPRSCTTAEFNQVRVGFAYKGYWSLVGADAVNLAAQYEQSMNFALFDINPPPEPTFSRVVLHEFGHALGFQHEHQRPDAPCVSDFDWDAIYVYLQGPPNYCSIAQIDRNLRPRNPGTASDLGPAFDRASIMLYSFPISFYKTGTQAECYTPGNNTISQVDIDGVLRFYPAVISDQAQVQQDSLQGFFSTVDALPDVSEEAKSIAKLTASNLSQGSNLFFTQQQSPWAQIGAGNLLSPDNQVIDAMQLSPAIYLGPPPKL